MRALKLIALGLGLTLSTPAFAASDAPALPWVSAICSISPASHGVIAVSLTSRSVGAMTNAVSSSARWRPHHRGPRRLRACAYPYPTSSVSW